MGSDKKLPIETALSLLHTETRLVQFGMRVSIYQNIPSFPTIEKITCILFKYTIVPIEDHKSLE